MSATTATEKRLPAHIVREIAVAAKVDPRTVAKVIAGKATRAATRERIADAITRRASLLERAGIL